MVNEVNIPRIGRSARADTAETHHDPFTSLIDEMKDRIANYGMQQGQDREQVRQSIAIEFLEPAPETREHYSIRISLPKFPGAPGITEYANFLGRIADKTTPFRCNLAEKISDKPEDPTITQSITLIDETSRAEIKWGALYAKLQQACPTLSDLSYGRFTMVMGNGRREVG